MLHFIFNGDTYDLLVIYIIVVLAIILEDSGIRGNDLEQVFIRLTSSGNSFFQSLDLLLLNRL